MTRYLSLWLPYLATERVTRLRSAGSRKEAAGEVQGGLPLATIAKIKSAQRLVAVDACAAARGLGPGLTLADARARCPDLDVVPAEPHAEAALLEALVDWCRRFTPLAALDAPGGAMLDITGAAHLFGGEHAMSADIEARLMAHGFAGRTGIGSSPQAAWALARFGAARRIAPADADGKRLARLFGDLPLAALGLEMAIVGDLARAGLRRIGDVVHRPRAPLAARFGDRLFAQLDGLLGAAKTAISPRFEAAAFIAERRFLEGLAQRDAIEATIGSLAVDLCGLLERRGEGALVIDLTLFRVDGVVKRVSAGASRPLRDPMIMARLFHERLEAVGEEGLETGYGFDVIRLSARTTEPLDPAQGGLARGDLAAADETADMAELVDRLGARLGLRRVTRLTPHDTHIPEQAASAEPAAHVRRPSAWPPHDEKTPPTRPIRLLQAPERIDTIAAVPDGPPLRFTWRRVTHEVVAIEGPERIAAQWWNAPDAPTRDYFRAEDRDGRRFWLFREGLFAIETTQPRWYVHGLFA